MFIRKMTTRKYFSVSFGDKWRQKTMKKTLNILFVKNVTIIDIKIYIC